MKLEMEKLFEQIFERKNQIINRAKQNADSYADQLASKLLIAGITPPPSLCRNPNISANEFKKEELLSQLLLPHPQPTDANRGGFYSLYNHPIVLEDKEEVVTRGHGGTHESSEGFNLKHGAALVSNVNNSETGSDLNAPEKDVTATSLQKNMVGVISDMIAEPANVELHVSKRCCNAEDRSTPLAEFNNHDVECLLASVSELDQGIVSPQGQKETRMLSSFTARDQSRSRIQRSKSRQKALELRKTVEKEDKIHQRDTNSGAICYDGETLCTSASKRCQPLQGDESLGSAIYSGSMNHKYTEVQAIRECLTKERDANPYSGRITRSRSSRNVVTRESKSNLGNSLDIADVDGRKTIQSLNKISNASGQRVTSSKSGASGTSPFNFLNGHSECPDQDGPSSELNLCCPDTLDIINQKAKIECLIETEVILDGPAKVQAACSESTSDDAGASVLEDLDSKPSSKSRMIVKPKTLDFKEMGKSRLIEVIRPMVEKEFLDKPLGKRRESSNFPASQSQVTFSNSSRKPSEKPLFGEEMSNQIWEPPRDSYETCLEECVLDEEQVNKSRTSKNIEEVSDAVEDIQNSILHVKVIRSSNAGEDIDMGMYHEVRETSYIPNQQVHKGEVGFNQMVRDDANDQSTCTLDSTQCHMEENRNRTSLESEVDKGLTSSEPVLLNEKLSVIDDLFLACDAVDSPTSDGKNFTSDEVRFLEQSSLQGKKLRYIAANTWPQLKRRKIESQENKFISADTGFRVKESHNIEASSNSRNLNSIEPNPRTALRFDNSPSSHEENVAQSDVNKSPDVGIDPKELTQKTGSLPGMPIEQDELGFGEKSQGIRFPLFDMDGECVAASSVSYGEAEDSGISFGLNDRTANATTVVLDVSTQGSEKDELSCNERVLETKLDVVEDDFNPACSVASPQDEHLGTSSSDRTMPKFEGFFIGEEESENRHIVGDGFDSLDLPTNSLERASLLEQLCKSAVLHTPVFRFSATHHNFHRTPDVYQSVPNGVLEHLDPKSTLNSSNDGCKQLRANYSSVNELNTYHGFHPDTVPYSDTYNDQSSKILPKSPVSKLWGRMSSKSFSSEKKLSSNPELTCFPIEEDPSISEEHEVNDVVVNSIQEDICSTLKNCGDKRIPLADISKENVNPPPSEKLRDRSSLDSVSTEVNYTGTHGGVKKKLAIRHSSKKISKNEAKKKLTLSISTNLMGIATESLNNRFSKPNLTRKTSLRNGGQSVSGTESEHNNIISNISSFVPLVQQKQAAALVTGKRDVKVKALEAAEAAKRLEEKKDNDRKLKREALKLERARMEQENLRQAELKKKKKEDDLKRKEADVAARKRLREEEVKKEKERKRRRFEGKRQQMREQEEKMRSRKAEKDLPTVPVDSKLNSGIVTTDALREPRKVKVGVNKVDGNNVKKPDMEVVASKSLDNGVRKTIFEGLEAFDKYRVSPEVIKTNRESSYEISPYQCSDDEDDEEDEISPRKFVPKWASKKSLDLVVSSQQNVNPDILFAPKSFGSVNEVSGLEVHKKNRRF